MDQKIKQIAEQYAVAHSEEQKELLRTLGKIPAPTRQEDGGGDMRTTRVF